MTSTPKTVDELDKMRARVLAKEAMPNAFRANIISDSDWESFADDARAIREADEAAGLAVVPAEATEEMWAAMNARDEAEPPAALWDIYAAAIAAGKVRGTGRDMSDIIERLNAACVGRPAKIAWPHRLLHDAVARIAALEAVRDRMAADCAVIAGEEASCDKCAHDIVRAIEARGER